MRKDYYSYGYAREFSISSRERIHKVLDMVKKDAPAKRILDVGCGNGSISILLKEAAKAEEIFGIELSPEGAKEALRRGVNVTVFDLEELKEKKFPYPDSYFDLIFCGDIIEHIFEPSFLLREVSRVLKESGSCIITTPNLASWYNRLFILLGYQPYGTACSLIFSSAGKAFSGMVAGWGGEHIRVMTLKAFKDLIKAHGFQICELYGCYGIPPENTLISRIAGNIDRFMSKLSPALATWLVARIRKNVS
jgi:methionine biosynthesis protein MetW